MIGYHTAGRDTAAGADNIECSDVRISGTVQLEQMQSLDLEIALREGFKCV